LACYTCFGWALRRFVYRIKNALARLYKTEHLVAAEVCHRRQPRWIAGDELGYTSLPNRKSCLHLQGEIV